MAETTEQPIPQGANALITMLIGLLNEGKSLQTEEVKTLISELGKINTEAPEQIESISDKILEMREIMQANPKYKNFQTIGEITEGIEGAVDLFNTFSNIATAKRQIREAKEAGETLVEPEIPPMTPKSKELEDATEEARRARQQPLKEIDPILQRNLDLLQGGLNVAKTASAGQAGLYGSLGQSAINQARRSNLAAVPMIQDIRRQQTSQYYDLLGQGRREDFARTQEAMQRYGIQSEKYLTEAQAVGQLGAIGQQNLALQRQDLGGALSESIKPISSALLSNINFNQRQQGDNQFNLPKRPYEYTALGNMNPKYEQYLNNINFNLQDVFSGPQSGIA